MRRDAVYVLLGVVGLAVLITLGYALNDRSPAVQPETHSAPAAVETAPGLAPEATPAQATVTPEGGGH